MNEIKITPRYYSGKTITDILQQEIDNADLLMRILSRLRYAEDEPAQSLPITCTDDCISKEAAIDAVSKGCHELRGIFKECEENIKGLPSVMPEPSAQEKPKSDPSLTQDVISRQEALQAITGYKGVVDKSVAKRLLMQMPSVMPEPQWIPCSYCDRRCDKWENSKTLQE